MRGLSAWRVDELQMEGERGEHAQIDLGLGLFDEFGQQPGQIDLAVGEAQGAALQL